MPIRPFPDPSNPATITPPPIVAKPNPILDAAASASTNLATKTEVAITKQEQITANTRTATEIVKESIVEEGRNLGIVAEIANLADLNAQRQAQAALKAAGGIAYQTGLIKLYKEAGDTLIEANDELAESKEDIGSIFGDFFRRQVGLSTAESRAELAEDRRDDIGETILGINTAQESIVKSIQSTKETLTAASTEASANAAKEQIDIKAAKAQLEGFALNSAAVARSMALIASDVQNKIRMVELQNSTINQAAREKAFQQQEEAHAQRLIEWETNSKARAAALEKAELDLTFAKDPKTIALRTATRDRAFQNMQDTIAFEASFISNVQKGQAALGLPIETAEAIRFQGMNAKSIKEREYYKSIRQVGLREGKYGQSPADALETISTSGVNPDLPAARMLISLNQGYLSSLGREKIPKTQALYNQAFDKYAKSEIASDRKEIKTGDSTNVFHAPPMSVLAERADVQASKLYKVALEPQKMKEFNDIRIYELALAGIASKELTIEEAVLGLETIFNAAVDQNNESKMFDRAGITPQTSYISKIIPSSFLSSAASAPLHIGAAIFTAGATASRTLAGIKTALRFPPMPLTDSTNPTHIRNTVARLIATSAPATFFGAPLKGASPFIPPDLKGKGEEN